MKKFLAILLASIVLVGCVPTETAPIVEEDTTQPDVVVEESDTTVVEFPEGVEIVTNEDRAKAAEEKIEKALEADVQIAEDKKRLDEISATRPLKAADCELVKNPGFKESCLVFAAIDEENEEE